MKIQVLIDYNICKLATTMYLNFVVTRSDRPTCKRRNVVIPCGKIRERRRTKSFRKTFARKINLKIYRKHL